jgi:lauroyl/myristoyl acyltransferase
MDAYECAIEATSTEAAPWYIIPADHKWAARAIVADAITTAIRNLDLKYPEVSPAKREALAEAKKKLLAEED